MILVKEDTTLITLNKNFDFDEKYIDNENITYKLFITNKQSLKEIILSGVESNTDNLRYFNLTLDFSTTETLMNKFILELYDFTTSKYIEYEIGILYKESTLEQPLSIEYNSEVFVYENK